MANYCELDDHNKVLRVIVVANSDCIKKHVQEEYPLLIEKVAAISGKSSIEGVDIIEWEDEAKGIVFCENLLGGRWIQTSYHSNIRRRYAGIGYTYDKENDVFISPQPYDSWKLDKNFDWQAPVAKPDGDYTWDEKAGEWVELIEDVLGIA